MYTANLKTTKADRNALQIKRHNKKTAMHNNNTTNDSGICWDSKCYQLERKAKEKRWVFNNGLKRSRVGADLV